MSLYNLVHGRNPLSSLVLASLGNPDVPRYRDAWLDDGCLAIYTRTGGGNRDMYEIGGDYQVEYNPDGPFNDDLRAIPGFIRDEDDDFDSTYATFYFNIPDEWGPLFKTLGEIGAQKVEKPGEAWGRVIADLKSGAKTEQTLRAVDALAPVFSAIAETFEGKPA